MAIRNIVKEGDEVLKKVCRPVDRFDDHLKQLVQDMKDTLTKANGLGLAAPQVGVLRRLFVMLDEDGQTMVTCVNPEIVKTSGSQQSNEGCLSVPGVWGVTNRPAKVTVKAYDENGNPFEMTRTGITAVCICHETDHLDGILFREHVVEYFEPED